MTNPRRDDSEVADPNRVNRLWWDHIAGEHEISSHYQVEQFLAGVSSLDERERGEVANAVGDVSGLELLHLQCHIGLDTISWARLGAAATGLDYSVAAIDIARKLADKAGCSAVFRVADAQRLPDDLAARFDVVFASYGIFYWIADIGAWMRSAAAALRPNGKLVVVETHPLVQMINSVEPVRVDFPYGGAKPVHRKISATYSGIDIPMERSHTVGYAHGIGEIVTAAAAAGLRIDSLTEYMDRAEASPRSGNPLTRNADGRYQLLIDGEALPVSFSLRATRRRD
ncbi:MULTISPECIES: class I SAM-dependent methyltransferase [unclassified Nocardia]|uniref:class I SAM-dependent methyltransferase n=1 Tax=unclassified Nocardia TaxID=2637762 RepID=UPI001CE4B05A|nr:MULTISPECIES: class I SAM-dependent methyltransferase [unclassified Nocardia]